MKTTGDGQEGGLAGRALQLERAESDLNGTVRRPLRLRLVGRVETTIEMSRAEAYAFSEWLDAVVTQSLARRGSKVQETKR